MQHRNRWPLRVGVPVALIVWAVGLQCHMWYLQQTPQFKEKFEAADQAQVQVSFGSPRSSQK